MYDVLLFVFFNYVCIDSLCIYFKCVWLRTKARRGHPGPCAWSCRGPGN